jgi:hypothetical protein
VDCCSEADRVRKILAVAASDSTLQKKGAAARGLYESTSTPFVTTALLIDLCAAL